MPVFAPAFCDLDPNPRSTPPFPPRRLASQAGDEVLVYGYHDPFITPNLLRRNEVGVVVTGELGMVAA